jgi:hypothetical protein
LPAVVADGAVAFGLGDRVEQIARAGISHFLGGACELIAAVWHICCGATIRAESGP